MDIDKLIEDIDEPQTPKETPKHNQQTGEIEEDSEGVNDEEPESLKEAKKYQGLLEKFEVSAEGMEENLRKEQSKIVQSYKNDIQDSTETLEEVSKSIIETDSLIEDFSQIRNALKKNIENTSIILEKYSKDLTVSNAEDVSGSVLMGYSELIKASNTSMKLLMESYDSVSKTQLNIKKLAQESKHYEDKEGEGDEGNQTYNINNAFIGDINDVLEQIRDKK